MAQQVILLLIKIYLYLGRDCEALRYWLMDTIESGLIIENSYMGPVSKVLYTHRDLLLLISSYLTSITLGKSLLNHNSPVSCVIGMSYNDIVQLTKQGILNFYSAIIHQSDANELAVTGFDEISWVNSIACTLDMQLFQVNLGRDSRSKRGDIALPSTTRNAWDAVIGYSNVKHQLDRMFLWPRLYPYECCQIIC